MKKNLNKEAYYERLRHLSNIGESKKSQTEKTLGSLINYKRGADNVAYGIVRENHQYFIKKSNNQKEPLVEDFAYIGGLENIHEYRYNKLSEADKNRNMLLLTINEALGGKNNMISENKSEKNLLSEEETRKEKNIPGKKQDMDNDGDIDSADYMVKKDAAVEKAMEKEKNDGIDENAEEELDKAEEKLKDAEQKTDNVSDESQPEIDIDNIDLPPANDNGGEEVPPEGGEEVPPEGGEEEVPPEGGEEEVPPEGGEEVPPEGGEEVSPEGGEEVSPEGGEEVSPEGDDENNREIQKMVGKVTNVIRKTDMEQSQIKSYLNSFISAFKDKLPDLEIGERKEIANKLIKVVPDGESELEDVGVADDELDEAKICNECGFAKYTKDRGYDEESLMECSVDEMSNLINGYAMECDGDVPEEDLASMAILSTPEVMESLTNDYGQDELNENMKPFVEKINEDESANPETKKNKVKGMFWWETKPQEKKDTELKTLSEEQLAEYAEMDDAALAELDESTLNELNLAGLKNVGSFLGRKAGGAVKGAAQGVAQGVKGAAGAVKNAVTQKIDQATQKLDQLGNEIQQQYQKGVKSTVEAKLQKAAQEFGELVVKLDTASQKAGDGPLNKQQLLMTLQGILKGSKVAETVMGNDPAAVEVQPPLKEEEGEEEIQFGADADDMGVAIAKPDGAEVETEEVGGEKEIEIKDSTVNITMNESEQKLRKYIRARLEEKAGLRKPVLNEDKKSNKIKKLDKMIDEQFELFESILNENGNLSEIFKDSRKNKKRFKKVNPNDPASIEDAFKHIFFQALKRGARARIANKLTPENKYNLMQQGIEVDGLENPGFTAVEPITYKPLNKPGDFGKGRSRLGT